MKESFRNLSIKCLRFIKLSNPQHSRMRSRVFPRECARDSEFPFHSVLNLGSRRINSRLQMRMHRPDAFLATGASGGRPIGDRPEKRFS